ncbi:MAG: hypothetical protein RL346_1587 [Verrucomicrobiota bacterium]
MEPGSCEEGLGGSKETTFLDTSGRAFSLKTIGIRGCGLGLKPEKTEFCKGKLACDRKEWLFSPIPMRIGCVAGRFGSCAGIRCFGG